MLELSKLSYITGMSPSWYVNTTLYLWSLFVQATGRLICYQRLLGVSWGSNTVEVRLYWKDQIPRKGATVSGCYNKFFILETGFLLIKLTQKAIQTDKSGKHPVTVFVTSRRTVKRHFTVSFENLLTRKTLTCQRHCCHDDKSYSQATYLSKQCYSVNCWRNAYDQKIISPKEKKTQDKQVS